MADSIAMESSSLDAWAKAEQGLKELAEMLLSYGKSRGLSLPLNLCLEENDASTIEDVMGVPDQISPFVLQSLGISDHGLEVQIQESVDRDFEVISKSILGDLGSEVAGKDADLVRDEPITYSGQEIDCDLDQEEVEDPKIFWRTNTDVEESKYSRLEIDEKIEELQPQFKVNLHPVVVSFETELKVTDERVDVWAESIKPNELVAPNELSELIVLLIELLEIRLMNGRTSSLFDIGMNSVENFEICGARKVFVEMPGKVDELVDAISSSCTVVFDPGGVDIQETEVGECLIQTVYLEKVFLLSAVCDVPSRCTTDLWRSQDMDDMTDFGIEMKHTATTWPFDRGKGNNYVLKTLLELWKVNCDMQAENSGHLEQMSSVISYLEARNCFCFVFDPGIITSGLFGLTYINRLVKLNFVVVL